MKIGVAIGGQTVGIDIPGRLVLEARRELRAGVEAEAVGLALLALSMSQTAALVTALYVRRGSLSAVSGEALDALGAVLDPDACLDHALSLARSVLEPHAPPAPKVEEAPKVEAKVPTSYGPGYGPRPKKAESAPGEG